MSAAIAIDELERATEALDAAMRAAGLDGQAQVFARLEDLQDAMDFVRERSGSFTVEERRCAVVAVERSRRTLLRLDGAIRFVEQILRERQSRQYGSLTYTNGGEEQGSSNGAGGSSLNWSA